MRNGELELPIWINMNSMSVMPVVAECQCLLLSSSLHEICEISCHVQHIVNTQGCWCSLHSLSGSLLLVNRSISNDAILFDRIAISRWYSRLICCRVGTIASAPSSASLQCGVCCAIHTCTLSSQLRHMRRQQWLLEVLEANKRIHGFSVTGRMSVKTTHTLERNWSNWISSNICSSH